MCCFTSQGLEHVGPWKWSLKGKSFTAPSQPSLLPSLHPRSRSHNHVAHPGFSTLCYTPTTPFSFLFFVCRTLPSPPLFTFRLDALKLPSPLSTPFVQRNSHSRQPQLFESNAKSHLSWFAAKFWRKKRDSKPSHYRPTSCSGLRVKHFELFMSFFQKKTGLEWGERILKAGMTGKEVFQYIPPVSLHLSRPMSLFRSSLLSRGFLVYNFIFFCLSWTGLTRTDWWEAGWRRPSGY